jgi:aldehyde dehydrogenase (NAD+)
MKAKVKKPLLKKKSSVPDMKQIFADQQKTALTLRTSDARSRIQKLIRLRDAIVANTKAIHAAAYADFKKPEAEVNLTEIFPVLIEIKDAQKHLKKWMQPKSVPMTLPLFGTSSQVRYEPKGVCLIISPWNYPLNLTFGPLVSALAAGNTVMIKPSEFTPNMSQLMEKIVAELFPPNEVAVFQGDEKVSTNLLKLPFDHIFFTGSPGVGKIVMAAAAQHLSSVTLELGGKSPVIVDQSANIKKAAGNIMWSKFANNGQTCIAPDLLYVHEQVKGAFVQEAQKRLSSVYGENGQAQEKNPDYCRIVNNRHFKRVKHLLDDAKAKGASVVAGGDTNAADNFIAPTLLDNVSPKSEIMRSEIFGPLLPIIPFSDLKNVIDDINSRPKPLALYIFGKNRKRTEQVLKNTSAGGTCINTSAVHFLHANLPFGGVNNSGIGNSHGVYGFRAFSHERAVLADKFSVTSNLFPPYTKWVMRQINLIVGLFRR